MRGFVDGFQHAEKLMRKALRGHDCSELWGDHGLIAATMRCVEAAESERPAIGATVDAPRYGIVRGIVTGYEQCDDDCCIIDGEWCVHKRDIIANIQGQQSLPAGCGNKTKAERGAGRD